ncbi:hypothetical protein UFOVP621_95 [uncultured Caudovirales phage]|uniref:Uncharacterized protein n=1 Tax=uncultured Caudovirales phage TaxID=2100421 RepID=A0A6J5NCX6_9CAUD|nr:hypothetical protein UFOVP621_95 [uncultured Caudovirales phage]
MIKKVRVSILIEVDENRGIDLKDPTNYNLVLLDHDSIIFDVDLKRKGEGAYRPRVRIEN